MGYHVTILKTAGDNNIPIKMDELVASLQSFPALSYNKEKDQIESNEDIDFVLFFSDGEIWKDSPSDSTIEIMIELSKKIGARVRGDELETYNSLEEVYTHPDDLKTIEYIKNSKSTVEQRGFFELKILPKIITVVFFFLVFMLIAYIFDLK